MLNYDGSEVENNLDKFGERALAALGIYCDTAAQKLETDAKEHRTWTDRSGDARKRLKGSSEVEQNTGKIVLAQGVDYGLWLELAHEKRYAIVEPTIRLRSKEILDGLENFVERLDN